MNGPTGDGLGISMINLGFLMMEDTRNKPVRTSKYLANFSLIVQIKTDQALNWPSIYLMGIRPV